MKHTLKAAVPFPLIGLIAVWEATKKTQLLGVHVFWGRRKKQSACLDKIKSIKLFSPL